MNVLNRKMFANRDARRKLANMGGILASSPELMNTAQMFAPGGQVSVPVKTKTVIIGDPLGGARYDVYSDGSAIMLATGSRIDPNNASNQAFLQMLQGLPDVTNTSISQPELENDPILSNPGIATEPRSMLPVRDNRQELQNTIESGTELVPGVNVPGPSEQYVMDKTSPNYTTRDPSEIPELASEFEEETIKKPMPTLLDADEDYTPTAAELDQELLDMGAPDKRFDVVPNAIDRIYGDMGDLDQRDAQQGSTTPKVKRGDRRNPVDKSMQKSIFEILGIGEGEKSVNDKRRRTSEEQRKKEIEDDADVETADVEEPGQRGFTPGGDDTIAALENIATGGGSSEEKVEDIREKIFGPGVDSKTALSGYQKKFNEMLGEDRDLNEEKWHTLAMIGFAIAAGEDSNALTNIAKGLLEGTKMAREDRATRQARKDKVNMLALEQFFADERLGKEIQGRKDVAQIGADARTSDDTWFDTAQGKNAIAAYRDIFGTQNATMKEEDKMPAFIKRIGEDSATVFFTLMNIPQEETQTDTRTLADIPDKKQKKSDRNKG